MKGFNIDALTEERVMQHGVCTITFEPTYYVTNQSVAKGDELTSDYGPGLVEYSASYAKDEGKGRADPQRRPRVLNRQYEVSEALSGSPLGSSVANPVLCCVDRRTASARPASCWTRIRSPSS